MRKAHMWLLATRSDNADFKNQFASLSASYCLLLASCSAVLGQQQNKNLKGFWGLRKVPVTPPVRFIDCKLSVFAWKTGTEFTEFNTTLLCWVCFLLVFDCFGFVCCVHYCYCCFWGKIQLYAWNLLLIFFNFYL